MPKFRKKDAILSRRYDILGGGHVDIFVWAPFAADEKRPDNGDEGTYACPYKIIGIGRDKLYYGHGEGSVQAMMIALQLIGIKLYNCEAYKLGHLTYFGTRDLSLPLLPAQKAGEDSYEKAELLTTANYSAVVMMPDNKFPYVAYPGVRLKDLISSLSEVLDHVRKAPEKATARLVRIIKGMEGELKYYEAVCRDAGVLTSYLENTDSRVD